MANDYTVVRYGTDTSGRGLFFTRYFIEVWERFLADPRMTPLRSRVIPVQGGFMGRNGGGAVDSEGYHDGGGAIDCRSREFTPAEIELFVFVASEYGLQFWARDAAHGGMDPHLHGILASDRPLPAGIVAQARDVLAGRSGLASGGADYHLRFRPIRTKPAPEEDPMLDPAVKAQLDRIEKKLDDDSALHKQTRDLVKRMAEQIKAVVRKVGA